MGRLTVTRRVKRGARMALTVLTRPTYRRSLSFIVARDELPLVLNSRGLLGIGVEVGVHRGEFSECILERWRGRRLISVDAWSAELDPAGGAILGGQAGYDELLREARERLARFGERSEILRLPSVEAAELVPTGSLDFVYVDAAHDLESVRADLEAWFPQLRPGGLLCGHDYFDGDRLGSPYGVASAVEAFCGERWLMATTTLREAPEQSWFIEVPDAWMTA